MSKVSEGENKEEPKASSLKSVKVEIVAAKPAAKAPRTKEQRSASFRFILGYLKRECCHLILGLFFILGASAVDLVTPIFIGRVIDHMRKGEFDEIGTLCLY